MQCYLYSPKVEIGGRAFSQQASLLGNHSPESVQEADTLSVFEYTLFDKVYS